MPFKTTSTDRHIIYIKDVQLYTGKCTETARRMFRKIRKHSGKITRDIVTVDEFCEVYHFSGEKVRSIMRMPFLFFVFYFSIFILFRDDLDLRFMSVFAWACLAHAIPVFRKCFQRLRRVQLTY